MSTRIRRRFPQILTTITTLLVFIVCARSSAVHAQIKSISIHVVAGSQPSIVVDAECAPTSAWSFRDSYAGVVGLGNRVAALKSFAANGTEITVRQIAPGQYQSIAAVKRVRYELNLTPPLNPLDAAKISWVNEQRGLLMLRDILPTTSAPGQQAVANPLSLKLGLPQGWHAFSNEGAMGTNQFNVADYDSGVLAIGSNLRESKRRIKETSFTLVIDGQWSFTDAEALDLAAKVYSAHRATFGSSSSTNVTMTLFPFPPPTSPTMWTAETRGSNVTLLSGNLPSKVGALAQLSTPLTHELFHLWVPNGLALDGDYDWFYEGFTVYEAARTAVRLDLLTWPEFLSAIGRAYDAYLANPDRDRWSLVEASKRRWGAGQSAAYSEAMVVAFLYDLKVRMQSRGKRSIESIYPTLIQKYGSRVDTNMPRQSADGNEAAINALQLDESTRTFVQSFVTQPAKIDLKAELAPFGLQVENFGLRTRVSVADQLSKQQRDLLRQLGYNDVARGTRDRKN